MAKSLPLSLIQQKNKIDTRNPWLITLDIEIDDTLTEYFVNNNEELEWGGVVYKPAPFKLGTLPSTSSGELPSVSLSVFNTAELAQYLSDNNGLVDCNVTICLVYATQDNSNIWSIAENRDDYPLKNYYVIKSCSVSRDYVSFVLGLPNYLQHPFPARLYHKSCCDLAYKGEYCWMRNYQYTPGDPNDTCNHTYEDCKRHYLAFNLNEDTTKPGIAYGGFPNIGRGSYIYR